MSAHCFSELASLRKLHAKRPTVFSYTHAHCF
jgi:hypothetical protein